MSRLCTSFAVPFTLHLTLIFSMLCLTIIGSYQAYLPDLNKHGQDAHVITTEPQAGHLHTARHRYYVHYLQGSLQGTRRVSRT